MMFQFDPENHRILHNRIRCNRCQDTIESRGRHHVVTCSCGGCMADGGHDYLRRGCRTPEGYTEESVICRISDGETV